VIGRHRAIAVLAFAAVLSSATPAASAKPLPIGFAIGLEPGDGEPRPDYVGIVRRIPEPLAQEMRGETWRPGCPVPLSQLRLLTVSYWGSDRRPHTGPLVVNAAVADDVVWVFEQLFDARFPIQTMRLTKRFRPNREEHDTKVNPTASFNCRPVLTPFGPTSNWSMHSYGLAIDINPLQNPFVVDGYVRNRFARPYIDRSLDDARMIHDGDVVVRSFAAIGWEWGGHWSSSKDYMHFSQSGT
jgi:hypothetical protein